MSGGLGRASGTPRDLSGGVSSGIWTAKRKSKLRVLLCGLVGINLATRAIRMDYSPTLLAAICAMFSSNFENERAVAAEKADRYLKSFGLTWQDLLCADRQSQRCWQDCAKELLSKHSEQISEKSRDFLLNILDRDQEELWPKQEKWVRDLCRQTGVPAW
jgi:hypothetical protein